MCLPRTYREGSGCLNKICSWLPSLRTLNYKIVTDKFDPNYFNYMLIVKILQVAQLCIPRNKLTKSTLKKEFKLQ